MERKIVQQRGDNVVLVVKNMLVSIKTFDFAKFAREVLLLISFEIMQKHL